VWIDPDEGEDIPATRLDQPNHHLRRVAALAAKDYAVAANPAGNDMWLQIDFGEESFEGAVLRYVQHLIAKHYSPLAKVEIHNHC
jgi:hypothetical protein